MKISHPVFKSLMALSLGTLGMCMSEFSIMGVLPSMARSLSVSIPDAGHFISAYALGVCVGAPLTVLVARSRPLRGILLGLMLAFIAGNAFTALAPGANSMLAARFMAGLPHGAYFGVASIVADRLAGRAYSVLAVSIVVSGATIANLVGVPCATLLTHPGLLAAGLRNCRQRGHCRHLLRTRLGSQAAGSQGHRPFAGSSAF